MVSSGCRRGLSLECILWLSLASICTVVQGQRLFFSEIVDNASRINAAFELFNPTCADVSLDDYSLEIAYDNGFYQSFFSDDGYTIPALGTFVICHTSSSFPGQCDVLSNQLFSDWGGGDDAIALYHNGIMIDHYLDAERWDATTLAWDTSTTDIGGVSAASYRHTLRRKAHIKEGIGKQPFAHAHGKNNADADYSEWVVYDLDTTDGLGTHEHDSTCSTTILQATCGLLGSDALLADDGYYDLDRAAGSTRVQIECPTDCLEYLAVHATLEGGDLNMFSLDAPVCIAAVHAEIFTLDLSMLPGGPTADTAYDDLTTDTLCQAGLVPYFAPSLAEPLDELGVRNTQQNGVPRVEFLNDATTSTLTGKTTTCVTSNTVGTAVDFFTINYLDVAFCTEDCHANGNGQCNQATGQCECYNLYYSDTDTTTFNADSCEFKACFPACHNRAGDSATAVATYTNTDAYCDSATGECICSYGSTGDQCLEFTCWQKGQCGNLAQTYGTVTVSGDFATPSYSMVDLVNDGDPYESTFAGITLTDTETWVDIDLGQDFVLGSIKLYLRGSTDTEDHTYNDDNYIMVSTDPFDQSASATVADSLAHAGTDAYSGGDNFYQFTAADVTAGIANNGILSWTALNRTVRYIRYQDDETVTAQRLELREIEVFERIPRGVCNSGECECYPPYFGSNCQYLTCGENSCNTNGRCDETTGTCTCHPGFLGKNCELKECPSDCSSRGQCDYTTGRCTCVDGITSAGSCKTGSCPNDCSSSGYCNPVTRQCTCDSGFIGSDCSVAL